MEEGVPFEFTKTTFRGDRYKYIVDLKRQVTTFYILETLPFLSELGEYG